MKFGIASFAGSKAEFGKWIEELPRGEAVSHPTLIRVSEVQTLAGQETIKKEGE